MEISPAHFAQTLLPSERFSFLRGLQRFDKGLMKLLLNELQDGNKILSVYTDFDGSVIVNLTDSFFNNYVGERHQHEVSSDAHYGGASYHGAIFEGHKLIAPMGK